MVFLTWHMRGPVGFVDFGGGWANWVGGAFVALGVGLTVVALLRMRAHRTTSIPHMSPTALVTDGIFGVSRNPIYLGDLFILLDLILRWNAPLVLSLLIVFQLILTLRFIRPEDARMAVHFGEEFTEYAKKTQRWS